MTTPYGQLPARNFWKLAVDGRAPGELESLWRPGIALAPSDRFATAGSCFAQHISRNLVAANCSWTDSEPAPVWLTPDEAKQFGYGVFSFRTGNIYTPALLRQWIEMALGLQASTDEVWEQDNRFFDPLRPAIEPGGYESADECLHARAYTLKRIRDALANIDVLIFTLGLTEGWRNAETGIWYPMCPGTLAGTFDAARHHFHNLSHDEIVADIEHAFGHIRTINSGARLILTVSPVPLTATATGDHVLVATTYSKSVLRAAAGTLAARDSRIDYFPSYEIIAAPPSRGVFYDANMRTVTADGVDCVMKHFFRGLTGATELQHPPAAIASPAPGSAISDDDDTICEEELLAAFAPDEALD